MMEEVHDSQHPAVGNILISLGELFINIDDKTHESVPILRRAVSLFRPMKSHRRNVKFITSIFVRKCRSYMCVMQSRRLGQFYMPTSK